MGQLSRVSSPDATIPSSGGRQPPTLALVPIIVPAQFGAKVVRPPGASFSGGVMAPPAITTPFVFSTVVAVDNSATAGPAPITLPIPAGILPTDVIIAIASGAGAIATFTGAGFIGASGPDGNPQSFLFQRTPAGDAPPGVWTFTRTGAAKAIVIVTVVRFPSPNISVGAGFTIGGGIGASQPSGTNGPTAGPTIALLFHAGTGVGSWTVGPGFTQQVAASTAGGSDLSLDLQSAAVRLAGNVGPVATTYSGAGNFLNYLITLG